VVRNPVTLRELEVFTAYCQADNMEAAAETLHISPQTVKNTLTVLYRKLGVKNGHQLAWKLWGGETQVITLEGRMLAVKVL
jgi:DNA-binding NarL/FixJ family response regulator